MIIGFLVVREEQGSATPEVWELWVGGALGPLLLGFQTHTFPSPRLSLKSELITSETLNERKEEHLEKDTFL